MTERKSGRELVNGGIGILLLAIGLGMMMADFSAEGFGRVALLLGAGLEGYRRLTKHYRRLEKAIAERDASSNAHFNNGVEMGRDEGFAEGFEAGRGSPRPEVVVDLDSRRCRCGKQKDQESVLVNAGIIEN